MYSFITMVFKMIMMVINKLVVGKAQKEERRHDVDAWLNGISELVKQVQSEYFAEKDNFKITFYPLISHA